MRRSRRLPYGHRRRSDTRLIPHSHIVRTGSASARPPWAQDRIRVTTMRGQKVIAQTDSAMKTMHLGADDLVTYAGLARIGPEPTDEWIASTLYEVSPEDRFDRLTEVATRDFRRFGSLDPHAFLGAGFFKQRGKRVPRAWIITNAWDDEEHRYDPRFVDREFSFHRLSIGGGVTRLWTVGAEDEYGVVADPSIAEAAAKIEDQYRRDSSSPRTTMNLLGTLHRKVAGLGSHIGSSAVVTSLPRGIQRDSGLVTWLEPPGVTDFNRFAVSVNYRSDFRGTNPEQWRQPGLVRDVGFTITGASIADVTGRVDEEPRRLRRGAAFGAAASPAD